MCVPPRAYSQGRRLDVADVAVGARALRAHTLEASSCVDAGCPAATVVLLAQTLVHICGGPNGKRHVRALKREERRARLTPRFLVTIV